VREVRVESDREDLILRSRAERGVSKDGIEHRL